MDKELFLNLKDCLNPNNDIRKNAEIYVNNLKKLDLSNLLNQLFLIINDTSNNIDNSIKNLCSVLYKNFLMEENNWINLPFFTKNKIREDLYNIIEKETDENKIKYLNVITANIAFIECKKNDTKMLKNIIRKIEINIKENNIKNIISYLYIMKTFFDKFEEEKLLSIDIVNDLQKVIMPIIRNFKDNNDKKEEYILELTLDIYILILPFLKYSFTMETDYIFKPVIDSLNKLNNEKIIYLKNLMVINDTINYYHRYIVNHIKTICNLLFDIFDKFIKSKDKNNINNNIIIENDNELIENIYMCYLDILCLICDKEMEDKTSLTGFFVTNKDKYIPILLSLLNIFPQFALENESWNISKSICYIISFIVNSSKNDENTLIYLLNYSSKKFNSISEQEKINSLLILSCCLESKSLKMLHDNLEPEILNLIEKINDKNKNYSYTISWILGKISETIPSVFTKDKFNDLIPKLINIINDKNKYFNEIRINISIVLGNLIKFYGDEDPRKVNTYFKSYYKLFINNFIESSCMEENIISGLSFYLLRVVMNAIQFCSNDLQDSLEIIFNSLLIKFDNITKIIVNNKSKINKEQIDKLYKMQETLCLVINQIFNKIIRKINTNLCGKLYEVIINSFLNREGVPYESGMLCLYNLVILLFNDEYLMKNNLNIKTFYQLIYAIFANDDKDNEKIKIISLLCILNLIKINSITLKNNIVEIYELLKTISVNRNDLSDRLKDLMIKTIEEIEKNKIYLEKINKNKIINK